MCRNNDTRTYFNSKLHEVNISAAGKWAEDRTPTMDGADKGQLLSTSPIATSVQLHICQRGSIINALSVKAISRVKFNGAYGK